MLKKETLVKVLFVSTDQNNKINKDLHFTVSEDDQKWIDACNKETQEWIDACNKETFDMIAKMEERYKEAPHDKRRWKIFNIWFFCFGLATLVVLGVLVFLVL